MTAVEKRKLVLLAGSFAAALVFFALLLFYQQGKESRSLSVDLLRNPTRLVQQIESEVDLLRQFQQERNEAGGNVAERLLLDNLINVERDKVKALAALARAELRHQGVAASADNRADPEAQLLRQKIQSARQQLDSLSGEEADKVRNEMRSWEHRLELIEMKREQQRQSVSPKSVTLTALEISLAQDRIESIERSSAEPEPAIRSDGNDAGNGMWADFSRQFRILGRIGRIRDYQRDIREHAEVIHLYLDQVTQEHQELLRKLASAGPSGVSAPDTRRHRESEEDIQALRRVNVTLEEQESLLVRWNDVLRRDRLDVALRLLMRLTVLAMAIIAILLLAALLREVPERFVQDEKSRYYSRKIISFLTVFAVFMSVLFALVGQFSYVGPMIGLVGAGLAIALQDVIVSLVGWFFIIGRLGISVGDRVEIGGVKGDVIDIGVFRIAMMEVGNWVHTDQSTGRVVFFPNSFVFRNHVFNYHIGTRFIWDEVMVKLTFDSDWKKAKDEFLRIARQCFAAHTEEAQKETRVMAQRFLMNVGSLAPTVNTRLGENGVVLIVRYLTLVQSRQESYNQICEKILAWVERQPDIKVASPVASPQTSRAAD